MKKIIVLLAILLNFAAAGETATVKQNLRAARHTTWMKFWA